MVEAPKRRYYQQVTQVAPEDTTNIYEKAAGVFADLLRTLNWKQEV